MFVVIAAVEFVGAPDIHHGQQVALVILAAIQDQRLVGPFRERVRIDEGIRPGRFEAGDQPGRLLQQGLHLGIRQGQAPS